MNSVKEPRNEYSKLSPRSRDSTNNGLLNFCFGDAPLEVIICIFSYLDGSDLAACSQVCRWWYDASWCGMLWEAAFKHQFGNRISVYDAFIVKKFQRKNNIRFHTTWSEGAAGADKIVSARIQKYEKKKCDNEEYVIYHVFVEWSESGPCNISRRYSDFLQLHKLLSFQYTDVMYNIGFPSKKWIGNLDHSFIQHRLTRLESFLQALIQKPETASSAELKAFLDYTKRDSNALNESWATKCNNNADNNNGMFYPRRSLREDSQASISSLASTYDNQPVPMDERTWKYLFGKKHQLVISWFKGRFIVKTMRMDSNIIANNDSAPNFEPLPSVFRMLHLTRPTLASSQVKGVFRATISYINSDLPSRSWYETWNISEETILVENSKFSFDYRTLCGPFVVTTRPVSHYPQCIVSLHITSRETSDKRSSVLQFPSVYSFKYCDQDAQKVLLCVHETFNATCISVYNLNESCLVGTQDLECSSFDILYVGLTTVVCQQYKETRNSVSVYNFAKNKFRRIQDLNFFVQHIAMDPDESKLVLASYDTLLLFSLDDLAHPKQLDVGKGISKVYIDSYKLVVGVEWSIQIYNLWTGTPLSIYVGAPSDMHVYDTFILANTKAGWKKINFKPSKKPITVVELTCKKVLLEHSIVPHVLITWAKSIIPCKATRLTSRRVHQDQYTQIYLLMDITTDPSRMPLQNNTEATEFLMHLNSTLSSAPANTLSPTRSRKQTLPQNQDTFFSQTLFYEGYEIMQKTDFQTTITSNEFLEPGFAVTGSAIFICEVYKEGKGWTLSSCSANQIAELVIKK